MRGLVVVAVAVAAAAACSGPTTDSPTSVTTAAGAAGSGSDPAAAPGADADPDAVRVPSPVPVGDVRITYTCGHSAKPFGTAHWSQTTIFDSASGRATIDRAEGDDADPDKTRNTHVETVLDDDKAAAIRAALARVLAGGPYRPERALPEGIACTLSLWVPGEKAFFTIDKSTTAEPDAVSELGKLVQALGSK
jgi:hypothetical protein